MKKLLLSAIVAFSLITVSQAQTWNASDANFAANSYAATTTIDGLTLVPASDKPIVIDTNNKNIDGYSFTKRIKLGGAGVFEAEGNEFLPIGNYLSFDVITGTTTVTIYGMSASSSEERSLVASNGVEQIGIFTTGGAAIAKSEINYTGDATTIYLYSAKSGFNVYFIEVATEGGSSIAGETADKTVVSVEYYDVTGRKVAENTQGLILKKLYYDNGTTEVVKTMVK